jgi:hypothetical protein
MQALPIYPAVECGFGISAASIYAPKCFFDESLTLDLVKLGICSSSIFIHSNSQAGFVSYVLDKALNPKKGTAQIVPRLDFIKERLCIVL